MPRKLKTYVTTSGFFELAVAAPSMKAALEAWGSKSNAFQRGFAHETDDAEIVKATLEQPGVVLRRPVGSKGVFMEHAELPKLSVLQSAIKHKRPAEPAPKKLAKKKREPSKRTQTDSAANRKAAQLYDLAEKRRQREQERADAQREKERDHRKRAVEKAQSALDDARSSHEERVADIEKQREVLERRERREDQRWEEEKQRLEAALAYAKNA